MTEPNKIFKSIVDYLYREHLIDEQNDIAVRTGITNTTISRILNDHVKKPSEDTWRRLNAGFDYRFNPQYFRGESDEMLCKEIETPAPTSKVAEGGAVYLPSWADTLINIITEQIKQNEELNRQLKQSIESVNKLIITLKTKL